MDTSNIDQIISRLRGELRETLYFNERRITRYYTRISEQDQLVIIDHLTKAKDELPHWIEKAVQDHRRNQALEQISSSPDRMAVLVEIYNEATGKLLKLPDEEFRQNAPLIKYVGDSRITEVTQHISTETTGLSDALAQAVQKERNTQEERMKRYVDDPRSARMFAWTVAGKRNLASIALWDQTQPYVGNWASGFHLQNPKGILGHLEEERDNIVYIAPHWIWHVTRTS
jgi:hypothetical protein